MKTKHLGTFLGEGTMLSALAYALLLSIAMIFLSVQIVDSICPKCKLYLSKLQIVFV